MALITANFRTDLARGSMARGAVEMANAAALYAMSRALTAAGVAQGTTAAKAKTVNTLQYSVLGRQFTKGATDDFWTLAGTTVQASSFQKYLLMIDTAGAASVQEATQSTVSAAAVSWANISAISKYAAFVAALGSTKCVVATLTIATDSSHTFVPGTTSLTGTGITATIIDGLDQSILPLVANETGLVVGNGG